MISTGRQTGHSRLDRGAPTLLIWSPVTPPNPPPSSTTAGAVAGPPALPWYRTITPEQWRALLAAKLGWMLDAMDFLLYVMAIGRLKAYFGFGDATAGLLGTITLLVSAGGGVLFGLIADRVGRTRALMGTILIFSLCSLGAATSQTLVQLLLWRALLGIGMGGEWASGAVLVSETWPPEHRTKAVGIMQSGWALGYILAAIAAALVLDVLPLGDEAWRWLFVVGVLPAFFTLWVRRRVPEPPAWARRRASGGLVANPFAPLFGRGLWGGGGVGAAAASVESVRRAVRAEPVAADGAGHAAHGVGPVRLLGSLLLAPGLSRDAGGAGRSRDDHRAIDELDHPDADRGLLRLPLLRLHRRPVGAAPDVRAVSRHRGDR